MPRDRNEFSRRHGCAVNGWVLGAFLRAGGAAECQARRVDEFSARRSIAKKLPHRRVLRCLADASVAVVGADRSDTGQPFLNGGFLGVQENGWVIASSG